MRDLSLTHDGATQPLPRNISFDVHAGECVLLLGPSGSGKSTLTLALNGLIPHAVNASMQGSVEVCGADTAHTAVAQLATHVGMVFQDPDAQIVTGSVFDEVAFGPENLLLPAHEVVARSEQVLRRLGLWDRRHSNPDNLSGGGRQRLALACALALQPRVLVLDEPTANLDPQGVDEVYRALADLTSGGDKAIVLIEHKLDAAVEIATRVMVLDHSGELVLDGPRDEILRGHAQTLANLGVWLPEATLEALRLREEGAVIDRLPLTSAELAMVPAAQHPESSVPHTPRSQSMTPDATAPPIITVRGLTVSHGRGRARTEVLHGVDLDIAEGSFTALVGANGAGKTTLMQAIAAVQPPPRGHIMLDGIDPGRARARDIAERVGFVFQNPEHQFITATVFDELAHGLRRLRYPAPEIDARVTAMLERFGLSHKAQEHPFLLSGGEKRRLSVGTALITRPRILALDEPTFGQDRARARALLQLLDEVRSDGTTIIVVTHDMQVVANHATHIAVVDKGRIAAAGVASTVLHDRALQNSALHTLGLYNPGRMPHSQASGGASA
ncbi:ABC transporter ATP-binding protein [Microbacterium sp. YY-01]|uniref:ABC transporter ATP-binding protein n=1 Tax=Microbacterium sp. YY-01 TaxID=3421634 RepID=UPI003D174264